MNKQHFETIIIGSGFSGLCVDGRKLIVDGYSAQMSYRQAATEEFFKADSTVKAGISFMVIAAKLYVADRREIMKNPVWKNAIRTAFSEKI